MSRASIASCAAVVLEVARELLPQLPPDYQPIAIARLAMATRAADAANLLRAVPAAKLNEPALRLERAQWLRRTGNLGEAKTAFAGPATNQSDAWWNERNQLARDLLAANRPADAYAVAASHGLTKGVAFADAEFLAGWTALRQLKKPADAVKHFQKLHDGVSTDISKSRGAYWLARAHESRGSHQGGWRVVRPRRRLRPDLLRPACRAQGARRQREAA